MATSRVLGSFEHYSNIVRDHTGSTIFIRGDLGPHCASCAAPSEVLCDYPVGGNGATCDRPLCASHANHHDDDIDYCADHERAWQEFSTGSLSEVLAKRLRPIAIGSAEND